MVQLQMYYGEIKNFYNKFMEDPEFVDAISAMYQQYATIKSEIVGINKNIRSIQYKNISKPLPERQREIDRLMNEWRVKQSQINEIYRSNQKLQNLIREHQEALADPTSDYQERLQSLQTAEQLVVRGDKLEEIPGNNLAEKIIYICNNALAGFTVVGRKTSAAKEFQSFKPLFKAATVLFNKFIRTASSYEFNKIFNKFVK
jgi:DNA repair exonuclease SbcCD ATPase subunit